MEAPFFYMRGKQAFRKEMGSYRLLGSVPSLVRRHSERYKLFHIIDLDALKGRKSNFDVYDHLTYLTHVQAEVKEDEEMVSDLLGINVRVVIPLPSKLPLEKYKEKKGFLVGKIKPGFKGSVEKVGDLYLDGKDSALANKLIKRGKRLFLRREDAEGVEGAFGLLFPL
jgi:hypothetical protein